MFVGQLLSQSVDVSLAVDSHLSLVLVLRLQLLSMLQLKDGAFDVFFEVVILNLEDLLGLLRDLELTGDLLDILVDLSDGQVFLLRLHSSVGQTFLKSNQLVSHGSILAFQLKDLVSGHSQQAVGLLQSQVLRFDGLNSSHDGHVGVKLLSHVLDLEVGLSQGYIQVISSSSFSL